ncbi:putative leader peptide [Streptomyces sp. HB2AG]|uniref:putative leader peptide n=1 Tax=Streptomyces sp. HB2AG TaxID=2983400 RepID=UPI0022AACB7C|nr:putative leader peptide [Streptomyces sp. HB2AG]MCZ2525142.1 hypothetical protein [Streptomyces sp. HB2AG]
MAALSRTASTHRPPATARGPPRRAGPQPSSGKAEAEVKAEGEWSSGLPGTDSVAYARAMTVLVSRRHVDLLRVASASCRPCA